MKIAAIVPAYNEEASIASVVAELLAVAKGAPFELQVVVINDCSTDTTSQIIHTLDCIALDLPVNLGIGGAVQTGLRYAHENNFDYAVQVDGDGQHPAHAIPELVKYALENNADLVIGSRFITREGFQSSLIRRAGINYFGRLNRLLVGVTVKDSTSGFRLSGKGALAIAAERYPDEYPEPEAIIIYSLAGLKVIEFPVQMRERKGGVSSINATGSVYYMFKVTLAILYTFIREKFKSK